jgi:hypothetical protein
MQNNTNIKEHTPNTTRTINEPESEYIPMPYARKNPFNAINNLCKDNALA